MAGRLFPRVGALALALAGGPLVSAGSTAELQPLFVERAQEWGLRFVHFNGMSGELYYPENMGSGCGLLDYDGDGDLDAYLVQGTMLGPGKTLADATLPPPASMLPLTDRLYRNDLFVDAAGRVVARFVDVTAASGLSAEDYGMGLAAADVDGDGWVDLYVANFGSNRLLRNRGDGGFADVTAASGADDPRFSVAAAFLDYDGDGRLDLYVANNVAFGFAAHRTCFSAAGAADYCGPLSFAAEPDRLLRNRGDGVFEDASARSGVAAVAANGLGVVAGDFDGDGRADLFVANDQTPNFLWRNRGDGTFEETGLLAGVAFNERGAVEGSMGIAVGDFDRDGDEDLVVTNLTGETNTLYENLGGGLFRDATIASGLGPPSLPGNGFGTGWIDVGNDGLLDLAVFNGEVRIIPALQERGDPYPLDQAHQLYRQTADGRFVLAGAEAGEGFTEPSVARGAAFGDVDNDGAQDILVANSAGPARLLVQRPPAESGAGAWLAAEVRGASGDSALGAEVRLAAADGARPLRTVRRDGSYGSVSDPRAHFGLGGAAPERLLVRWPDGRTLALASPPPDRYLVVAPPAAAGSRPGR